MKTIIAVLGLVCAAVPAVGDEINAQAIKRIPEAESQVGKFPWRTGPFLKSPCVVKELQRILGEDFKDYYHRFLGVCGCHQIEKEGNFVWAELRVHHVGPGWGSMLFFDVKKEKMHLFWVKSSIPEGDIKIYGERPLPEEVRSTIVKTMMGTWHHLNASFVGNEVRITLKSQMKNPVTKEVSRNPRLEKAIS